MDVALTKHDGTTRSIKWTIGQCISSISYDSPHFRGFMSAQFVYTKRCCIEEKQYTLTCEIKDMRKKHEGWAESYLTIQGRQYCHDFVGYSALRKVSINGILSIQSTQVRIHINSSIAPPK